MMRVFVTADDFGLHPDLNRAIADGVMAGDIHGASVSANGDAQDWPLLHSMRDRGASIGAHLTWVDEPWLTGKGGLSRLALARRLLTGGSVFADAVRAEARAQIEKLVAHGVQPTHLDSHQHVHVMPKLWQIATELAREFEIPRIRVPWTPSLSLVRKSPGGLVLQVLSGMRRRASPGSWPCVGIAESGHNTRDRIGIELASASHEVVELIVHPGIETPELRERYRHWNYDWEAERNLLAGEGWRKFLEDAGCASFEMRR